ARMVDTAQAPGWTLTEDAGNLLLTPYALFTVERKSGLARLYALLRAEIPGADKKPAWSARYFARAPGEYPLDAPDGWMTDGRFEQGMRTALERALAVCADDTH